MWYKNIRLHFRRCLLRFLQKKLWYKAELFYIQKLVLCIEAHGNVTWQYEYISQKSGYKSRPFYLLLSNINIYILLFILP